MNNLSNKILKKLVILCLVAVFMFSMTNLARAEDEWIAGDKGAHVAGGFLISAISFEIYYHGFKFTKQNAVIATLITGATLNLFKEYVHDDEASWKDITAGTVGNLAGVAVCLTFDGGFKNWNIALPD
jgi:hypothetical protein